MARRDTFTTAERVAIAIGLRMLAASQVSTMQAETARQLLAAEFGDAADQAASVERGTGRHIRAYLINGGTPDERVSLRPPEGERGVSVQPLGVVSWLSDEALARISAAAGTGRTGRQHAAIQTLRAAIAESLPFTMAIAYEALSAALKATEEA